MEPFFTNDAIVFGLLMLLLAAVFYTSSLDTPKWKKFYTYVPGLLLCYFLPAILHWPLGLIASEWFDPSILKVLAEQNLVLPEDNMSFGQIKFFLETNGMFEIGYENFIEQGKEAFNIEKLNKFLESKKLALPAEGMAFEEIRQFLEANKIGEFGYKRFIHHSNLYFVASRYLLPASLVLLCLSIDLKGIINLGPKALIMFFAATLGIVIGGPIALFVILNIAPEGWFAASPDEIWRGLATVAGSWIGGGANQTAMKEIFEVGSIFTTMVVVDVVVANIWMGFLLYGANISDRLDNWLKADSSAIEDLKKSVADYRASIAEMPTTTTLFMLLGVAFFSVSISHWGADVISAAMKGMKETLAAYGLNSLSSHFFWLVVFATTIGLVLSFTKLKKLEGVGASRWGSIFIYILVATIGMHMNIGDVFSNMGLFLVGLLWMLIHVIILLITAKIIKAPFFFVAVGSQANVGGAASAPVVASAFSPSLAPVGVLMAVLGYALGTYGALLCAWLMQGVAG